MLETKKSKVYVMANDKGHITRCEGGYTTPEDLTGWVQIDEGAGDKYNLCQSHYFDGGLHTSDGIPRYKLVDGKAVERTEEEIEADRPDPLHHAQYARQEENKAALSAWLAAHPYTWTDGKKYGVEEQDQNEMALNLMQYQAAVMAGQDAPLEWHAQKEACRTFTQEEYLGLSMAISAYVYPYRRYQEKVKQAIYSAKTAEEVDAIVVDYASVSNK